MLDDSRQPLGSRLAVGNKADLEAQRQVSTMEGKELAKTLGIPFIEASAKVCFP